MNLNKTSEIGKTAIYDSPCVAAEQIVIDLAMETVTTTLGETVITIAKEAYVMKQSIIDKVNRVNSLIEKSFIKDNPVNKISVLITETEKMKIVRSFIRQLNRLDSRVGMILLTDSMFEKRYNAGSLIDQTLVIKSKIQKEALDG